MKLLACVLLLGACGSGADFSTADSTLLARTFVAARGDDLLDAERIAWQVDGMNAPDACPRVVTVGARTTVDARGCENQYASYEGTLVIDNGPDAAAFDPAAPTTLTFDHLAIINKGTGVDFSTVRIDGTDRIDGRFADPPVPGRVDAALTVDTDGAAIGTDWHGVTYLDGWTEATGSLEIEGLGTAGLEGLWRDSDEGSITLHGDDELTFHLDDRDAGGCMRYTIDDADGHLCGW